MRWMYALAIAATLLAGASGCVHGTRDRAFAATESPTRAQLETAGARIELHDAADGQVDLSEAPVIEFERSLHGFHPGPLFAATTPRSWLPSEDEDQPTATIELGNGCRLGFDYVFAASDDPSSATLPRRHLEASSLQTQLIPPAQWLHLWRNDRWLGAAVVVAETGTMMISPSCDALEVDFAYDALESARFAIHWELEVDSAATPSAATPDPTASDLQAEQAFTHDPVLESWLPPAHADATVELRLANACAEPMDYAFVPALAADEEPIHRSSLPALAERRVEVPSGWWLRLHGGGEWHDAVTTSLDGAVVWLAANCIDHGIADGSLVAFENGGPHVDGE